MPDTFSVAIEAALDAGKLLKQHFGEIQQISYKDGSAHNLVTEMDRASEALIADRIRIAFPDHQILAEEGSTGGSNAAYRWLVDPLDGTTNYAHHSPIFAVSIGLEHDGRMEVGVVYAPVLDELFVARRGDGATLNERPIHVSDVDSIEKSVVSTAWSYDRRQREREMRLFNAFSHRAQGSRRIGSAALELAYVGEGRFDAFWFWFSTLWDVAAAMVVVSEAGGRITDAAGAPFLLGSPHLVATNGLIHQQVLDLLAEADSEGGPDSQVPGPQSRP